MLKLFNRYPRKVDPEELNRQTEEVNSMLEREAPRREHVARWLIERKGKNGFGEDFDITFQPKEA